jgi:peptide/nickel transport system substrate-binding protein
MIEAVPLLRSSSPGLSRGSTSGSCLCPVRPARRPDVDGRDKPGHDVERGCRVLTLILALALLLAAPAFAEPPSQPSIEEGPVGQAGGELRMLIASPRDTRQLPVFGYARLVAYRPDYTIVPDILLAVEDEADRVFTLHLRPGHKWSDGALFTSEDFRYWWEDVALSPELSPAGPPAVLLRDGEKPKVEILDPLTVRYSWSKPMPGFLAELAGPTPIVIYRPAHYLKQFHIRYADPDKLKAMVAAQHLRSWAVLHNRLDNPTAETNPDLPSLDPWVLTTRPPAERFVFERNPYYYRVDRNGQQLPYLDRVTAIVADARLIPAKTGAGEADLQARGLRFDNYTFLKAGEAAHHYAVHLWQTAYGSQQALYPDLTCRDPVWRALFRDTRFRRALSLGIDRHEINNALYYGLAVEGQNTLLPGSPLYGPSLRSDWAGYDPEAADKLLDEIGLTERDADGIRLLPDGRRLQIVVEYAGQSGEESDLLELIHDSWAKIGVELFAKPYQITVLHNRLYAGDTLMTIDRGLENGLATAAMSPAALAPLRQDNWQWPRWGQYAETHGLAGEAPDLAPARDLLALADAWVDAGGLVQRSEIWRRMLHIQSDEVYTIGLVAGVPQPVVIAERLRNVPDKAVYNFDPGALFGIYKPDRFWLAKDEAPARP